VPMRSHLAMTAGRSSNRPVPTMKAIVVDRRYIRLYSSIVTTTRAGFGQELGVREID
jgi:hypothetical protein